MLCFIHLITMKDQNDFLEWLEKILSQSLFTLGDSKLTVGLILTVIVSLTLLFIVSEWIRKLLVYKILRKRQIETGTKESIGAIVKYLLILAGIFSILQTTGIDLSAFGVLAGAIGVGIGFGLQNITNNFISGMVILFEQPIKVGDRIEVGDVTGDVVRISARSTTVLTNDNISIIVPNSQFIDNPVINWSLNERKIRFNFPVGVAYKENPEKIKNILVEVANANPGVLKNPGPDVLFDSYGESSLNFSLRVWSTEFVGKPRVLRSQLYYEIFKKFAEHDIELPFPQRDLHLKSGFEKLIK